MTSNSLPEELRRRLEAEWRPVQPLPSPWRRSLVVAVVAAAIAGIALLSFKLRSDLHEIPMWLSWGCSLLELGSGIILVGLALRESVPGIRLPAATTRAAIISGLCLQILVGLATWAHSPNPALRNGSLDHGVGCLGHDTMLAIPTFVVALWLIFRALPTRAPMAGLLGGAGAAITADAIIHLQCPISDLRHVLTWHTGAIFLFMLLGWTIGQVWQLRGRRHLSDQS